jgi:hypothetical protein
VRLALNGISGRESEGVPCAAVDSEHDAGVLHASVRVK